VVGSPPRPGGRDREITAPCVLRFGLGGLRQVREVTARWAARAGLVPGRAGEFVIAVNEIATNAVRYGSPAAQLVLRVTRGDMAQAEVRDQGRWPPGSTAAAAGEERGGMGLPLARQVCDAVEIRAGGDGTTVILRMRLPGRRGRGRPEIR
jgi:serine/threonine-protein kinase RsbW